MTYKTKSILFVFALAAMLVAWPLTAQQAYAGETDASLDADCPVNFPATLSFSAFAIGVEGAEEVISAMSTGGTKAGNLRIDAEDWKGDGQADDGSVTFQGVGIGDIAIVNGITYTGIAGTPSDNITFEADAGDVAAATSLTEEINAGDGTDLTATATLNTVLILDNADGDNSKTLSTTDAPRVVVSAANLEGGEANDVVHMLAEDTHYLVTSTGTPPSTGSSYASKLSLNSDAVGDLVVLGTTDRDQPVNFIFHITGVGTLIALPYSGTLTQELTVDVTCVA